MIQHPFELERQRDTVTYSIVASGDTFCGLNLFTVLNTLGYFIKSAQNVSRRCLIHPRGYDVKETSDKILRYCTRRCRLVFVQNQFLRLFEVSAVAKRGARKIFEQNFLTDPVFLQFESRSTVHQYCG